MTDILLIEDEESVNRGIAFSLEQEGYRVRACRSLREGRRALRERYPDILLCDINLPDGSGLELIAEVREAERAGKFPDGSGKPADGGKATAGSNVVGSGMVRGVYIVCLTALDQETDQVMGYGAGADDYMTKPFSLSVLSLKLRAYLQRQAAKGRGRIVSGELTVEPETMKVVCRGEEIALTKNEWKLLQLLLENSGRILSKNQILEQLFDADGSFVDANTVAVNINRLREKIEPERAKPVYIKNVRGLGYVWSQETRYV